MKSNIILFVGIIILGTGILAFSLMINGGPMVEVNGRMEHRPGLVKGLAYGIGGGISLLGFLFVVGGLRGKARNKKQNKDKLRILKTGVDAEGTITFVDKNYSLLVNQKPIYSIVEYVYQDKSGTQHTRKVDNIHSDIVIRRQFAVGATVNIKYDPQAPSKSVIMLLEAAKAPNSILKCDYCGSKYSHKKYTNCPNCGSA